MGIRRRKNTRFSEKQIRFLDDMYEEGEKTKKKDPATVANMNSQGADQQKLFSPAEYVRWEQVLSFFSRITSSR